MASELESKKAELEALLGMSLCAKDLDRLASAQRNGNLEDVLTDLMLNKARLCTRVASYQLDADASKIDIQSRAYDLMDKHESELKKMLEFYEGD